MVAKFPQTLPANTVVGRLGTGPGPSEAIPLADLSAAIIAQNTTQPLIIINDSNTVYIQGDYSTKQNVTAGYTRGTDFVETISVNPATFPNDTFTAWDWVPNDNTVKSYPLIEVDTGLNPISSFQKIVSTFAWTIDEAGGASSNVLHECWLNSPTTEIEVILKPYKNISRSIGNPIRTITGGTHFQEQFDVYSVFSGWQKYLIYPTNAGLNNEFDNGTLSGSVNGTPGTDPTHCTFRTLTSTGITKTIVGSGTTVAPDGTTVNYVDVRFNGTPVGNGTIQLEFGVDNVYAPAAIANTEFIIYAYLAVVAGSTTNIGAMGFNASTFSLGGSFLRSGGTASVTPFLTSSPQRFSLQYIINPDEFTTGFISAFFSAAISNGSAIDVTFRVGNPVYNVNVTRVIQQDRFDWLTLFNTMIANGYINASQPFTTIQIAPEIFGGHGSFHLKRYSVDIA